VAEYWLTTKKKSNGGRRGGKPPQEFGGGKKAYSTQKKFNNRPAQSLVERKYFGPHKKEDLLGRKGKKKSWLKKKRCPCEDGAWTSVSKSKKMTRKPKS